MLEIRRRAGGLVDVLKNELSARGSNIMSEGYNIMPEDQMS